MSIIVEAVGSTKPVLGISRGDFVSAAVNKAVADLYAAHEIAWRKWKKTEKGPAPAITDADILACKQKAREAAKAEFSKKENDEIQRRARAFEAGIAVQKGNA